jgi:hypothetical protein
MGELGKKPHDRLSSSPAGTSLRPVVWMKCKGKQGTKQTQTCNSAVTMPFPGRYWVRRRSQEAPTQQSVGWHSKVIHVSRTSRSMSDPHYSIPCSCADARSRSGATVDVSHPLHLLIDTHKGASRQGPAGPCGHHVPFWASRRFPVRGLLPLVSLFEHQYHANEARDMHGRRTHLGIQWQGAIGLKAFMP